MKRVILFLVLLTLLCSCKTRTISVPVETVKAETKYIDRWLRDSIHVRDSVFVAQRGDTVLIERYNTIYKERIVRDSIFVTDSVRVDVPFPVEVTKTVKAPYTWYEKLLMALGLVGIGFIGFRVYRLVKK